MSALIFNYGMGVDSTAMIVGMHARGERPDLILFADTGGEKPETYAYLPHINAWLEARGWRRARPPHHRPRWLRQGEARPRGPRGRPLRRQPVPRGA